MSNIRKNITAAQRFEFGFYQFMDHFFSRKLAYPLFKPTRKYLYNRIGNVLQKSGEGKVLAVDRIKFKSKEHFYKNYVNPGKPVVLDGFAKDWPCVKKWSLEYFDKLHGKDKILLVNSKHIEQKTENITLSELISDINNGGDKYYRFYPLLSKHPEHIDDFDYQWLKSTRHKKVFFEAFQVFMGGKGTESPLHNAMSCNLFVQVYGEKRWSLISPHHSAIIDPDPVRNVYRSAPFRKNNYPFNPFNPDYEKPFELYRYVDRYDLTLKPGDILWNPPFWWHSVVNLSESIGVGYRWNPRWYSFKQNPLFCTLDHLASKPPIWKGYKISKEDVNLLHKMVSKE